MFLIKKDGMHYRHGSCGYVSHAIMAEVYTESYAKAHAICHDDCEAIPIADVMTYDEVMTYMERLEAMREALNK